MATNDFTGRFNRIPEEKRKGLYDATIEKFSIHTVLIFLDKVKKKLLKLKLDRLPGSFYWVDGAMLFLHWLNYYFSFWSYQNIYGIPHATANRVVNFFISKVN